MNTDTYEIFLKQLKRHEGYRGKPYKDTAGHWTVGYGRNLDARPFSELEAERWLDEDIDDAAQALERALPWVIHLDDVRYFSLLNMVYNMGINKVLRFRLALDALEDGDYAEAAKQIRSSKYAKQVKGRAVEIAAQIETGKWA